MCGVISKSRYYTRSQRTFAIGRNHAPKPDSIEIRGWRAEMSKLPFLIELILIPSDLIGTHAVLVFVYVGKVLHARQVVVRNVGKVDRAPLQVVGAGIVWCLAECAAHSDMRAVVDGFLGGSRKNSDIVRKFADSSVFFAGGFIPARGND